MPEFQMDNGGPIVTIGPDSLDAVRIRVREATYPNGETERQMVNAVDRAVFDRVRFVEQGLIENARRAVERHDERIREAGEITEALNGLATRLSRGASPSEVAEEFQKLQARAVLAQQRLAASERDVAWHRAKVADPYAAAQHAIGQMPISSFRPIDPSPYLDN